MTNPAPALWTDDGTPWPAIWLEGRRYTAAELVAALGVARDATLHLQPEACDDCGVVGAWYAVGGRRVCGRCYQP